MRYYFTAGAVCSHLVVFTFRIRCRYGGVLGFPPVSKDWDWVGSLVFNENVKRNII